MRSRYSSPSTLAYSFGPGPVTPVVKGLLIANIAMYVLSRVVPAIVLPLGLVPQQVIEHLRVWQVFTYMFLHAGITHILFNMLALWMFGVELERTWGSRYFAKFYAVCGVAAGVTQIVVSFVPLPVFEQIYYVQTVGASGAIFGLLLAYALYFPSRSILMFFVFPVPVRYAVAIMGSMALLASIDGSSSGVASTAHLGGLVAGYLYLKGGRVHLLSEIKYRYLKWRVNRMRRKFDVYSGGRSADDVNRRVH
jgi:membrane associated rhomboid family serine protease